MKLLPESVKITELNFNKESYGFTPYGQGDFDKGNFLLSIDGSLTINFQSSGDFSQFIKKDGTLKRKKLNQAIGIAILNHKIEL